ncbi:MAG: hypothetical protein V1904_01145, partial [Bacteroidota bacterium]
MPKTGGEREFTSCLFFYYLCIMVLFDINSVPAHHLPVYSEAYQYNADYTARYYVTGETVPALCPVVCIEDKIYIFDHLNPAHYFKLIGLTQTGATKNLQALVVIQGKVTYWGWGLIPGEVYYADNPMV